MITGKVDSTHRVHYSNKVMKKIFAKQILNKEHVQKLYADNESTAMRMKMRDLPQNADYDLIGASIHTDDSMSKLTRKDGSPIRNRYLVQTKGFAPSEFTKKKFTKKITLKYDNTKFRPDFAIAPAGTEETSIIDQEAQMNLTQLTASPS